MQQRRLSLARFQVVARVAFHEVGPAGCLGLVPLANHLQEAAAEHARHLGVSISRLAEAGLGWVMTRLLIRMERWPPCGETIHIETWPSKRVGHLFYREFRLRDGSNLFVGAASSSWALFDVHARRVATTPKWLEEAVPWDPEEAVGFEHAAVPRIAIASYERSVVPRLSDLDINGHVNNAQLLGWTLEALPREVSGERVLREIDVQFRHECRLDDQVASRAEAKNADVFHHNVIRVDAGRELVRARSLWRP
jgi:fatty acyl-ACP thioesterase A